MSFLWSEDEKDTNALVEQTIFTNCPIRKGQQTFPEGFSFEDGNLTGPTGTGAVGVVYEVTPDAIVARVFLRRQDKWHLVSTQTLHITSSSEIYQIFEEDASKSSWDPLHPTHQQFFIFLGNHLQMTEIHDSEHPKQTFTNEITKIVSYLSKQITDETGPVLVEEDKEVDFATATHTLGLPQSANPLKVADIRNAAKSFFEVLKKIFTDQMFNIVYQDDCAFVAGVLSGTSFVDVCSPSSEFDKLDLKGNRVLFLSLRPLTSAQKADIKSLSTTVVFISVHSS